MLKRLNRILMAASFLLVLSMTLHASILADSAETNKNPWSGNSSTYFKVISQSLSVYDNSSGKLVKVGELIEGETYKREKDYGNWHQIQFGSYQAYVHKSDTIPATKEEISSENTSYSNSTNRFITEENTVVYDNSSGSLVSFAVIEKGKEYPIVSDYGNWYRVVVSGRVGYVHKGNVKTVFSLQDKYFKVIQNKVPVYDNRSGSLVLVGYLEKGQAYPRISDYGNWHKVQFSSHYGYVHKSNTKPVYNPDLRNENKNFQNNSISFIAKNTAIVYDNSSGELVPFAQIEKGKQYSIISDYGNWYRVLVSGRVGYINKDNVSGVFSNDMKYFKVNVDKLPVYDNQTGSLVKVGELKHNQIYPRVSDYGNWHKIQFGNYFGYVKKEDTLPVIKKAIKNESYNQDVVGSFSTSYFTTVYDNSTGDLIPFAELESGISYPINKDYGNWLEINVSGRYGYVSKSIVDEKFMVNKGINVVDPRRLYTYEEMEKDINRLKELYPGLISTKIIGSSVDGRKVYALKLGFGKTEIFFNGSHHAREWITTNLLMEMIDSYSQAYVNNHSIDGYNVENLLRKVSIWYVPMVNPDGVSLVQLGTSSAKNPEEVLKINGGSTNFGSWKANIRGVDLNRQYPAGWEDTIEDNIPYPAPQFHKGYAVLSEPEAQAIYNFTLAHNFKTAVAYHSSGENIFWKYMEKDGKYLEELNRKLANMFKEKTGYNLIQTTTTPTGAVFSDWFIDTFKMPVYTPEVSPYIKDGPVPIENFDRIWKQNYSVGLMFANEAINR